MKEIILTATCGHEVAFLDNPADVYRQAKIDKITGRACRTCRDERAKVIGRVRQMEAARIRLATGKEVKVGRGQDAKLLPAGTTITLVRQPDGTWTGRIEADGTAAEATANGLMDMNSKLAKRWLAARGAKVKGAAR